jgi:hypothetical protein
VDISLRTLSERLRARLDEGMVSIIGLKKWVHDVLRRDSPLRLVISLEKNTLGVSEFLYKSDVWLKLARVEEHKDST